METVLNSIGLNAANIAGTTSSTTAGTTAGATAAGAAGTTTAGYSIQSLVQSLSLTGNIMIDSFIIMNVFTFCKEWGELVVKFVISLAKSIFMGISHYAISYIKSKLTGKIVFRTR